MKRDHPDDTEENQEDAKKICSSLPTVNSIEPVVTEDVAAQPPTELTKNDRVIYIGNLPANVQPVDIFNVVRGGIVESMRIYHLKSCAFVQFADHLAAQLFFNHANIRRERPFEISGSPVSVRWAKPVNSINASLSIAISQGASRCIYIGNITPHLTEPQVMSELGQFGTIETIRFVNDKTCVFVNFCAIADAMKAMEYLTKSPAWNTLRIGYGKDRCDRPVDGHKSNFSGVLPTNPQSIGTGSYPPPAQIPAPSPNQRVIYLGNLAEGTTLEDICNSVRAGGPLYSIAMLPEKHCAFLTFINPETAQLLYLHSNSQYGGGLVIKSKRIHKVSFAKDFIIPKVGLEALRTGASRNIYIGNVSTSLSAPILQADFCQFGNIEQIYFLREKKTAFVNFCSILEAAEAMKCLKDPASVLFMKYAMAGCKISYGRDRVAGEPRNFAAVLSNPLPVIEQPKFDTKEEKEEGDVKEVKGTRDEGGSEYVTKSINAMQDIGVSLSDQPLVIPPKPFK